MYLFHSLSKRFYIFLQDLQGTIFQVMYILILPEHNWQQGSSGILPVNAHAKANILNLNCIDSFIFLFSWHQIVK